MLYDLMNEVTTSNTTDKKEPATGFQPDPKSQVWQLSTQL